MTIVVLFDLGPPGLLLGFKLKHAYVLAGLANAFAGGHQGAVGLHLSSFGGHEALPGLYDAGVHLIPISIAKGAV
ncbi:hypothetical protein VTG60DRAFT_6858 [Thermothelomyces hinnuleus]